MKDSHHGTDVVMIVATVSAIKRIRMEEDRRIVAVLWLSGHVDIPRNGLRNRYVGYEEEWDWNVGQTPVDPILGIPLKWDIERHCYVPFHVNCLEDLH
jgi:hypothetical protein